MCVSYKWVPVVDEESCTGCGLCVDACGPKCLRIANEVAVLNCADKCGSEAHCIPACPETAIHMQWVPMQGNPGVGAWVFIPDRLHGGQQSPAQRQPVRAGGMQSGAAGQLDRGLNVRAMWRESPLISPPAQLDRDQSAGCGALSTLKFNDRARSYAQYAVVQRRLAAWLAEWLEPRHHTEELKALELGAGNGLFTRLVAPQFARTTAVDSAPRMVQQGRRRVPRAAWSVADGWACGAQPVDRLFSASFLHWCDDPVQVLRHWRGHLKPGGRALHGFYVAPTLVQWQAIAGLESPIEWQTPAQWEQHFRDAGWTVLRSETRNHEERFSSALAVLRFFHRTGSVLPQQSSVGTVRRLLADFDRSAASAGGRRGVATTWTFFRIEVANE